MIIISAFTCSFNTPPSYSQTTAAVPCAPCHVSNLIFGFSSCVELPSRATNSAPGATASAMAAVGPRNLTHQNLGVLLGLALESLLAGGEAADGRAESSAGDEGSHLCGVVSQRRLLMQWSFGTGIVMLALAVWPSYDFVRAEA